MASAIRPRPVQLFSSPCLAATSATRTFTSFARSSPVATTAAAKSASPSVAPLRSRLRSLALQWTARASRRASSTSSTGTVTPISHPIIGKWFLFSSSLVFGIVVVGGITRLTESGLSITEWNLIRGMAWPSTKEAWDEEFNKYQQSPEYKLLNHNITIDEFKNIFYWEWFHRNLGRTIGMVFLLPAIFFTFTRPSAARVANALGSSTANPLVASRWMSPGVTKAAWACCVLVGFQGALGWYMVKSGLENDIMELNHATPRVSQYRLAAHLGSAFVIYVISLWNGFEVLRTWSNVVKNNGVNADRVAMSKVSADVLAKCRSVAKGSHWVAGLVFLTALSGAFVAGLDAGLVYNTWPMMGDRFVPPAQELFRSIHKTSINGNAVMDPIDLTEKVTLKSLFENQRWKNIFENPVTVQTDHRLLAYTTFAGITTLWLKARRLPLPRPVHIAAHGVLGVALAQVTLGITTLLYFVPIELAAAHQGGSLALLTSALWLMHKIKHAVPK
ncbi:cytochrome oxidase assembly protein-domain-containing protein [Catenaria anguillulae PL171]|uniref:Cytochrome oxidase assembly protein-domain-containing protein n=1 Tax=Catenaria anguillulae PL171 TaxID=765915 RepID=A0A1Y2HH77_9FUNG|nr:cytochrome oxidase assembly protein-domain-containing protein [Catenaria anguillulae PL171]